MRKDSPSSPPSWLALIACACTPKQAKTVNQNTYTLVLFCFDPPCVHSSRCTRLEIEADERPCAKTVLQGPPPGWLWAELPVCIFTKLVHRQPRVLLQVCLAWYPAAAAPASASHRSPLRRPHRFPRSERVWRKIGSQKMEGGACACHARPREACGASFSLGLVGHGVHRIL